MTDAQTMTKAQMRDRIAELGGELPSERASKAETHQALVRTLRDAIAAEEHIPDSAVELAAEARNGDRAPDGREPTAEQAAALEVWEASEAAASAPEQIEQTLPDPARWEQLEAMAERLARSTLIPERFRGRPDDLLLIALTSNDLGVSLTLGLQKLFVAEGGKLGQQAELMRMLVRRDGHQLDVRVERDDNGRPIAATAYGRRRDDAPDHEREPVTFTLQDALDPGLIDSVDEHNRVRARSKSGRPLPWETYTEDMLVARATARWCRRNAEESLGGISYTPEELAAPLVAPEGGGPAQAPEREVLAADDGRRTHVEERIAALDDDGRAALRDLWKQRQDAGQIPALAHLTAEALPIVNAMLERVEADHAIGDAEVVDTRPVDTGDPTLADDSICGTCGVPINEANEDCPTKVHAF